ncbi:acyl-CoA carboxylase epsilon subunit [Kitasatospora sp. NPDC004289]
MAGAEQDRAADQGTWRVVRGRPDPRELAVLAAVLAAVARRAAGEPRRARAGVPGWAAGHRAARSWRTAGGGGLQAPSSPV